MAEAEKLRDVGHASDWLRQQESRLLRSGSTYFFAATEALLDPLALVFSLWALAFFFEGRIGAPYLILGVIAFSLTFPGSSKLHVPAWKLLINIALHWFWIAGLLVVMGLLTDYFHTFSIAIVGNWLWLAPLAQAVAHLTLRAVAPQLLKLKGPPKRAVIVGLNDQGVSLARHINRSVYSGIDLLGFFDDAPTEAPRDGKVPRLVGRLDELASYVKKHRVQAIYLSLPMAAKPATLSLLDELKDTTASIYFVPDMFVTDAIQARSDSVCGVTVIAVCDTPYRGIHGWLKRASDIFLSIVILALIMPAMLLIALAIKLESPGPVIFRQRRYGLDGEQIVVYKFRSMAVTEDGAVVRQASRNDLRVTRLGRILRRTSLDELPQFINVLQGRMSIVGPRPHAVAHNELYRSLIKGYMVRYKVRPGITGWAQVNGQRGETDTVDKMQDRVDYDLDYLRNWSLQLDFFIILKTIRLVFKDSAAY